MTDFERQVTEFLLAEADAAALPAGMYERVVHKAKIRRAATLGLGALGLAVIVVAGTTSIGTLGAPATIGPAGSPDTPTPTATEREVRDCPLTIPSRPAFVPPRPYPSRYPNPNVPNADDRQWYGSAGLWTAIDSEGEVWRGLPDDDGDGKFTEKTFWWSEGLSDRSLSPITLTGRRLDKPGSFETGGPGGGGFNEDIKSFILVGIEIPAGCWELTATYRGAELSYVVLVEPN